MEISCLFRAESVAPIASAHFRTYALSQVLDGFGPVHLLFNNAGVTAGGALWEVTWNDWEWAIGINLCGVIHGIKVFTPLMLAQSTECIARSIRSIFSVEFVRSI
jgi:NADP-dependent 3-hydroxy acid dehydrogenase YdfG